LLSDRGEAGDPNLTPQQAFQRLLDLHFDGVTMGDVVWHSKWETWVRLADTFRQGNVFLAGDAAHVHSTTGGQGMNCCMQDAFNLGWKLALVLKGYANPELLETYETERRPVAEQVIWAASSLHDIFMRHGKDIATRTHTMFDPEYKNKVVNTCSGVAYTYKDYVQKPADLTEISGPAIGDRAPDIDFEQGGTLFDRLRHEYFTLLVMPREGERRSTLEGVQRRFPKVLTIDTLPGSEALSKRYGPSDGRLILVRPDGYIGFKCRAEESHLLERSMQTLLA
jgi:NADPH-dependent dioxygenase